ncbi:MAG: response regulator transcription factor [Firmicutes bacterium]|nr:response regulator transcription factor [Bacillota bacterium]
MEKVKILFLEDDKEINYLIENHLKNEGYDIDCAYNGEEAVHFFSANDYHMVILDIMVPGIDGYEVLRQVREKGNIPVLILSAKDAESDKIVGLGLGADDYMTKPFKIGEFTARVKAQLRRYLYWNNISQELNPVIKHMDIEMDLNTYEVRVSGNHILLTAKEFGILKLFMTNPKKVFTKAQIFRTVWEQDYILDENTVMVHIRRLREKIEPDPSKPTYIQTVWGIGYKISEV